MHQSGPAAQSASDVHDEHASADNGGTHLESGGELLGRREDTERLSNGPIVIELLTTSTISVVRALSSAFVLVASIVVETPRGDEPLRLVNVPAQAADVVLVPVRHGNLDRSLDFQVSLALEHVVHDLLHRRFNMLEARSAVPDVVTVILQPEATIIPSSRAEPPPVILDVLGGLTSLKDLVVGELAVSHLTREARSNGATSVVSAVRVLGVPPVSIVEELRKAELHANTDFVVTIPAVGSALVDSANLNIDVEVDHGLVVLDGSVPADLGLATLLPLVVLVSLAIEGELLLLADDALLSARRCKQESNGGVFHFSNYKLIILE